jgi:hypothetical protein
MQHSGLLVEQADRFSAYAFASCGDRESNLIRLKEVSASTPIAALPKGTVMIGVGMMPSRNRGASNVGR